MSAPPFHRQLHLSNVTVFANASFEFSPGVNAFIGENGTGKTHLLKYLYAYQRPSTRDVPDLLATLLRLFQIDSPLEIVRTSARSSAVNKVSGIYGDREWSYNIARLTDGGWIEQSAPIPMQTPVFLPAIDMMGHTREFLEAYNNVFLDFDLTCRDIVTLFRLRANERATNQERNGMLANLLGGELTQDDSGRFHLVTSKGHQAMPMVAEGLRKIAALLRVQRNGWLAPGATLYWDEPEVNLNPVLMDKVVGAILTLARQGVQVFLATHSYVILKELDLQSTQEDAVRYFSLKGTAKGTQVMATDDFTALTPNPILQHYGSLYDRDLARAIGRNHRA